MATPAYRGKKFGIGRRGPSTMECALALSVIAGLTFVTLRIVNMEVPASSVQPSKMAADAGVPALIPNDSGIKTP